MPRNGSHDASQSAGRSAENVPEVEEFQRAMELARSNPEAAARELLHAKHQCGQACRAAEEMEELLQKLLAGNASLYHLEAVRHKPDGRVQAVVKTGNHLQEVGVHPDVDVELLERLQTWEYVCVNEGLVIGTWHDDPLLLSLAKGDIVEFKGFADRETFEVRIARPGHDESTATLAGAARLEQLRPGMKLVLQRDDPRWAIAVLPAEHADSPFEVPLDQVHTRLEDLAGVEELAERFIEDVLLRVVFTDLRDQFDLAGLRGAILSSYKPGMGKTAFMRAFAGWLREFGQEAGFDTVLLHVKPNQLKSMWWGEDARIVREELWGAIRALQAAPKERPLVVIVVLDEFDALQKRAGSDRMVTSSSHSDALEALLAEMDGLIQQQPGDGPRTHVLCVWMTNRPDRIDDALKRPGRFGDLVLEMPEITRDSAEAILAVYARKLSLPWQLDGEVRAGLGSDEIRAAFLRPAVARVFPAVVLRYATDSQRTIDVTAGEILSGAHYEAAMNLAKRRAALRRLYGRGVPALAPEDVTDCLLDVAIGVARQMEADPAMLVQQLRVQVPVARVTSVPKAELEQHRFLKVHADWDWPASS